VTQPLDGKWMLDGGGPDSSSLAVCKSLNRRLPWTPCTAYWIAARDHFFLFSLKLLISAR
jgi:hypothetical protein